MGKSKTKSIVGGGPKKVLYTLNTVRRIGLLNSAKALKSSNACKACGLGMGGQRGGMINELGEFPSVCNKSIQAQSTDIQQPIPEEVFQHNISEFKALSNKEIERLGRLNTPLFKPKDSHYYEPKTWEWALDYAASQFSASHPDKTFFYASGRSSNEAAFVLQLLARAYGTNNVNNCSYYCHQATGVGLASTIGTGTATVELEDLSGCDLVFLIGANPSSNHPRLIHQLKHCRDRGADVIVINPAKEPGLVKFAVPKSPKSMLAGGTEIASEYLQPKIGSDLALLSAIGKALIEGSSHTQAFIDAYTQGFESYRASLEKASWSRLCEQTGLPKQRIEAISRRYAEAENVIFAWGMGITHHTHGSKNVEAIANLALLRGMVGKRFAGLLPLRGHSNVQGVGTMGVKPVLAEDVLKRMEAQLGLVAPKKPGLDTLACLTRAHEGSMDAALIMGGNLYEASPDSMWAKEALDNVGFKLYLTTTLNRGHLEGVARSDALVLPVTARDEERQSTTQESMFNYVRMSDGGIDRLSNVRPEVDILCDLALRMLPDTLVDFHAFKTHRTIRQAIAKTVTGMENIADIDVAKIEFHVNGRLLHKPVFNTPSRRANFVTHQDLFVQSTTAEFPFTLMSVRSEGQFNSIIYEESDSYRGTKERWSLLMGQADMTRLGLAVGDTVDIRSAQGKMEKLKLYLFDLPAGNLMAYYPEANVLIGRETDPRSKTPAFKAIPVVVECL